MTKFYAQEKRVFDINRVTVVGNLTITSDGIASGFKSYNSGDESYLTLPTVFNPQDKPWKIIIKATIGEWISGAPYASLLGTGIRGVDYQGIALALGANQISCWLRSNTGTGWDIGNIRTTFTFTVGETYYFQIEFTGTKYILSVSKDRKNWEIKGSIESTTPIYVSAQPLTIGDNKYNNIASTCWTGSIDLMETYIYIDNEVFFNPTKPVYSLERRKEGFDLSKFTVVGSPTITEAGVASGFDNSNYIQIKNQKLGSTTKISIKAKRQTLGTSNETFFRIVDGSGTVWRFYFNASGSMDYVCSGTYGILGCDLNTTEDFIFNIEITPEQFKFSCFKGGQEHLVRQPVRSRDYINIFSLSDEYYMDLGSYSGVNGLLGSIDLSQFSITVDGKEVFTGAKEKFYAMRRM